jgi:hypothetical protein
MPDGPRPIVANTPSPPLPRKSPESPLKRPPNKPKILCSNSLDTQLPSQYTPPTQKRVLIKFLSKNEHQKIYSAIKKKNLIKAKYYIRNHITKDKVQQSMEFMKLIHPIPLNSVLVFFIIF